MISIQRLIDDSKCYEMVRELRWPDGVTCPHCCGREVVKNGNDTFERERQRYACSTCRKSFDDLMDTVFADHYQPLRVWMLCSYLMGLICPICKPLANSAFQKHKPKKSPFSRSSRRSLRLVRWSRRTSTTSTFALRNVAMLMRQFVIAKVNTLGMMTMTDSMKSTSTQRKEFGHFFAVGFVHIEAFRRRDSRCVWLSSNSFTTLDNAERRSLEHSSKCYSNHQPGTGDEP